MKRLLTLVSLLLMVFGISRAQETYSYKEVSVDKIEVGKKYALRQSHNSNAFLRGFLDGAKLGASNQFNSNCIFSFEKVGTKTDGSQTFDIFVLKNLATGMYISTGGGYNGGFLPRYVANASQGFKFVARKAEYHFDEPANDAPWIVYSNHSNGNTAGNKTDDGLGSWVFCSPDARNYMTFRPSGAGANIPFFEYFRSHNAWQVYEVTQLYNEVSVNQIQEGKRYLLRESNNSNTRLMGYLNGTNLLNPVIIPDMNCVYSFEKVDTKTESNQTFDIFVLRNEMTGKYVSYSGQQVNYVAEKAKAFRFTARKAVFRPNLKDELALWDWMTYSNAGLNTFDNKTDDGLGSWVFCAPDRRWYMTFRHVSGTFPFFEMYRSHDAWQVYECTISSYAFMKNMMEREFKLPVTPENYPIGEVVGCVKSEAFYQQMESAYNKAKALIAQPEDPAKAQEYDAAYAQLKTVVAQMDENYVALKEGHYMLVCDADEDYYGNKPLAVCDPGWDRENNYGDYGHYNFIKVTRELGVPAADFEHANYIWKLEKGTAADNFYVRNLATNRYFSKKRGTGLCYPITGPDNNKRQVVVFKSIAPTWFNMVVDGDPLVVYDGKSTAFRESLYSLPTRKNCSRWYLKPISDAELAVATKNPFEGKFIRIKASAMNNPKQLHLTSDNALSNGNPFRSQFKETVAVENGHDIFYQQKDGALFGYTNGNCLRVNGGNTFRTMSVDEKEYNGRLAHFIAVKFTYTSAGLYEKGAYNLMHKGTAGNGNYYVTLGDQWGFQNVPLTNVNAMKNACNFNVEVVNTLPVTVSAAKYATFYCPVAVNIPAGVKAYTGKRAGQVFQLQEISDVIPANTAVVLVANEGLYNFELDYENKTAAVAGNELKGQTATDYEKQEIYTLQNGANGVGLYPFDGKKNYNDNAATHRLVAGFKGYLPETVAAGVKALSFEFDGETTGIETVEGQQKTAVYYDLNGKRVLRPAHGVYITGEGKKIFIP